MSAQHWGVLLLTAALFGSSFFFVKLAVGEVPPLTIAAGRAALAAAVVYGFMRLAGQRFPKPGAAVALRLAVTPADSARAFPAGRRPRRWSIAAVRTRR